MFKIPRIEKSNFYLECAINAMQEKALTQKQLISKKYSKIPKDKNLTAQEYNLRKRKELEIIKIQTLNVKINKYLKKIIEKFPKKEHLEDIYIKLIDSSDVPFNSIEENLENIDSICFGCDVLTTKTIQKITDVKTQKTCDYIIKKYLGKISKTFKKYSSSFNVLSISKQFINQLPKFEDLYTIAIAGFPNVGKSTLLKKLSGSNVEIQNYPFTTKGLMFGYITQEGNKHVQLIDTPGLLGRKISNNIEKKALIIINDFCKKIIFVLDLTESCGYSITEQITLLKEIQKTKKEILIYLSKTDIYTKKEIEDENKLKKKLSALETYKDHEILKKDLIQFSFKKEGFDIKLIKKI